MKNLREERKCLVCGKNFFAKTSPSLLSKGKYCSRSCSSKGCKNGFKKGHKSFLSYEALAENGRRSSATRIGKKLSPEHKKKLSLAKIGRKIPKEQILNMCKAQLKRWSLIPKKIRPKYVHSRDKKYLQWRSDVFTRDNWTCQTCGKRGVFLEAHHISSWAHFPELRLVLSNGVSLCRECHKLTDNYKNKGVKK